MIGALARRPKAGLAGLVSLALAASLFFWLGQNKNSAQNFALNNVEDFKQPVHWPSVFFIDSDYLKIAGLTPIYGSQISSALALQVQPRYVLDGPPPSYTVNQFSTPVNLGQSSLPQLRALELPKTNLSVAPPSFTDEQKLKPTFQLLIPTSNGGMTSILDSDNLQGAVGVGSATATPAISGAAGGLLRK
jgi:hypothetical protein